MGPPPRDVVVLLAVVFVTFSLQFFTSTASLVRILRLTPLVYRGFLWQLATYPFIGYGDASLWFLLELLILFWFGRDVYSQLGRKHFWRVLVGCAVVAGAVAVAAQLLIRTVSPQTADLIPPFSLMQGQRMLLTILVAAFATMNRQARIYLFFVLPIEARWFLGLEILFAFMGFLASRDLAGFLGICAGVGATYLYLVSGGGRRGLRQTRLKIERWWLQQKLERTRRKRGIRVVRDEGEVKRGPWTH
ncbi:MAG TPA: hypothetical protein VOA87_22470 [Thermoanaerobaculia bacterium]|nr:hypothetical protein [Thermoanaerobaculia bacterium]